MYPPITRTLSTSKNPKYPLLKDKNIWIVEDDRITVLLIELILRKTTANTITLSSFAEVQSMIMFRSDIHLVILDLLLEDGMHGVELIKLLKITYPLTPVIVQTAIASPEIKKQCLESGCDAFFLKPWSCNDLLNSIEENILISSAIEKQRSVTH